MEKIKGYKVTDNNGRCRDFQFELGKTYEHKEKVILCQSGFHFCLKLNDCFNYYDFDSRNRVFEIEASGKIIKEDNKDSKQACSIIKFVKELTWQEVLDLINIGYHNTGRSNSGDCNSGHSNSGNCNTGHSNSGNHNSGYHNSGNCNTGYHNAGNRNSGYHNSGYYNSGNHNSGNRNSGDYNSGHFNSGHFNSGDRNSGVFCTSTPELIIFNKPAKMTMEDFLNSKAYNLILYNLDVINWISSKNMTEQEKTEHSSSNLFLRTF